MCFIVVYTLYIYIYTIYYYVYIHTLYIHTLYIHTYIHTLTILYTYIDNRLKAGRIRVAQARTRASVSVRTGAISLPHNIGSSLGISGLELSGYVACRNHIDSSNGILKLDRSVLYQQESSNNSTQRLYDINTTSTATAGTTNNVNICELSQLQATTTPGEFSNINNTDTTTEEGTIPSAFRKNSVG